MTLEELMEENLKLKTELDALNTSLISNQEIVNGYKTKEQEMQQEMQKIRDLNMNLFLKVSNGKAEDRQKEEPTPKDKSPVEQATGTINNLIQELSQF